MLIKKQNTIFEDRIPTASDNLASKYSLGTRWINNLTGKQYRHITDGVWVLEISEVEIQPLVDKSHIQNTDSQLQSPDTLHVVTLDNGGTLHVENISQVGSTYETHAEQVYTTNDIITLRDGATVGLATGEYAGFKAKLYDGINDGELVFDKDGWARVGDVGDTKKIATITDDFSTNYLPKWDGSSFVNSLVSDDGSSLTMIKSSGDASFKFKSGTNACSFGSDATAGFIVDNGLLMWYGQGGINNFYRECKVQPTTQSTSPTTGALVVSGGIGAGHVRANNFYGNGSNLTGVQLPITLTTNGTSGAATFENGVMNVPNYDGGGGLNQTQTTLNGSISGSAVFSMPFQAVNHKLVTIYPTSLNGDVTYTFPVSFPKQVMDLSKRIGTYTQISSTSSNITISGAVNMGGVIMIYGY